MFLLIGNLGGYENNVVNQDIHIDAAIFCNSGGFSVENLGSVSCTKYPWGLFIYKAQ